MKKYYLPQVIAHKWYILVAGIKLGQVPLWRLLIHDWSKLLPIEYRVYARRFTGKNYSPYEWDIAWLHHIHHNPHHHEYWILRGNSIEMPVIYIREMVVDWLAAGRSYQGSWDIQDWVTKNVPNMNLHPKTMSKLTDILSELGVTLP
jgi:hypothetical protein